MVLVPHFKARWACDSLHLGLRPDDLQSGASPVHRVLPIAEGWGSSPVPGTSLSKRGSEALLRGGEQVGEIGAQVSAL